MQPIAYQHGSHLASWEKTGDVSCRTVWVCILFLCFFVFTKLCQWGGLEMLSLTQTGTTQALWIYWRGIDTKFRIINVSWLKIVILLRYSSLTLFQNNMDNKKKAFCVPRKAGSSDIVEGSAIGPKPPPVKVIRRSSANPTPTCPTATLKIPFILDRHQTPKPKLLYW